MRENDTKAKRVRARLRREANPCHLCGGQINYDAHHLDPRSFQVDHLWQIANGGPEDGPVASSHRACNRLRSDKVDAIAVAAAAQFGVTLTPPSNSPRVTQPPRPPCSPDGEHCPHCNGVHNPQPGVTFITSRKW